MKLTKSILKEIIREEIQSLNEMKVDPSVEKEINEFGELANEIDRITSQLQTLKSRYSQIEEGLRPILEELDSLQQKSLQTNKYLVTIKRKGYERENMSYKTAFEEALTKVNAQTRNVLNEILNKTKSISKIASSVGVQRIGENVLSKVISKIKSLFTGVLSKFKNVNKSMDVLQNLSKKLT